MIKLNINTDSAVVFTNKLEKMHKSALPNAIRGALNKAAFNTKKDTLLKSAKDAFVERQPNFFKANSKVEMAKGFNVNSMKATIGMTSQGLKGANNYAVKDLEQQEEGGAIGGRSFLPLKGARIGKNLSKRVKVNYRLDKIKNTIHATKSRGKNGRENYVRAAHIAKKLHGDNAFVLGNKRNGRQTLSRIDEIWGASRHGSRRMIIKRTPLYSYIKGYKAKVKGSNFAKRAAHESGLRIGEFFIAEARKQFERLQR